ncbi:glutathione S-transferase family protein [Halioxenophilus aromaticivorans]|uniref:Glutathione S-transferase family protein n=1 Tax=Halioxenophilus aromaticivorans TaxID=1306992 RepID=A0AAV3U945_9ALTE
MLVKGKWQSAWQPVQNKDEQGRFIRQTSYFRNWITADGAPGPTGNGGFKAEPGRYHLYIAYICPWASRALMARAILGLTDYITVSVVNPQLSDQGWRFGGYPGSDEADVLNHCKYLHQLYTQVDPSFTGRATVPVLWDNKTNTIVNNESADIVRMLNSAFRHLTNEGPDLYPSALQLDIDQLNRTLYTDFNNGVYQAGFASSQQAYDEAYEKVFAAMDGLEHQLADGRQYLFGEHITETDIRAYVTLVRFDLAYYGLFKCNRNRVKDMPNLHAYLHRVLALDAVKSTVKVDHIKAGYYSIKALNPTGIVPVGPAEIG